MSRTLKEMLNCERDSEIRKWLREEATDQDVEGFIAESSPRIAVHQHAVNERDRRYALNARKPHWSVTPNFIVAVLAMIFAAIAAWPVIRAWFR